MRRRDLLVAVTAAPIVAAPFRRASAADADLQNTIYIDVSYGRIVIAMRPDLAPKHCERIKILSRQGFYDNTPFHRVIEGFMAQGGDPTGTGMSGSKLPDLQPEFTNAAHFLRGTCGMARASAVDSANSQFFIMLAPNTNLNGKYTIWGNVTSGMEFVDKIKKGTGNDGMVTNPDRIVHMRVAADA